MYGCVCVCVVVRLLSQLRENISQEYQQIRVAVLTNPALAAWTQDGNLLPVGTMALLEKVEWSQLMPEDGGGPLVYRSCFSLAPTTHKLYVIPHQTFLFCYYV